MKKALSLVILTGILATGFGVLTSAPAKANLTCFQECRQEWRQCSADPCSCVTDFEYCLAQCN